MSGVFDLSSSYSSNSTEDDECSARVGEGIKEYSAGDIKAGQREKAFVARDERMSTYSGTIHPTVETFVEGLPEAKRCLNGSMGLLLGLRTQLRKGGGPRR